MVQWPFGDTHDNRCVSDGEEGSVGALEVIEKGDVRDTGAGSLKRLRLIMGACDQTACLPHIMSSRSSGPSRLSEGPLGAAKRKPRAKGVKISP